MCRRATAGRAPTLARSRGWLFDSVTGEITQTAQPPWYGQLAGQLKDGQQVWARSNDDASGDRYFIVGEPDWSSTRPWFVTRGNAVPGLSRILCADLTLP